MNTQLCFCTALKLLTVASILAASGYLVADDSTEWSRQLSIEYVHASSVQLVSTKFAVGSSDGWFANLAASSETSDFSQAAASADSWTAGSGKQINAQWHIEFGIDKWQGNRAVSQQTIATTLGYSGINWLVELSFSQRELRIEGQARNGGIRKHFETFDGGELNYEYFFSDLFSLGLGYAGYQSNPGAVFRALQERPNLVLRLGEHSFGLVTGQAENALNLVLTLQLQDWYVSAQAQTADNYFNDSNHTVFSLYVESDLTNKIAIGGEFGVQSSDDSGSSRFISVAAHYAW